MDEPAAWRGDPTGRFGMRYWDGRAWTDAVSNGVGHTTADPYVEPPTRRWEYAVYTAKVPDVSRIQGDLERFGEGGWELVSMTTTVKTWWNVTGNDLVLVFKRMVDAPADLSIRPTPAVPAPVTAPQPGSPG
jgi:hypothetical protein